MAHVHHMTASYVLVVSAPPSNIVFCTLQIEGLPVYGVAIPTVRGLRNVLDAVGAYQGEPRPAQQQPHGAQQQQQQKQQSNASAASNAGYIRYREHPSLRLQRAQDDTPRARCKHTGRPSGCRQQQLPHATVWWCLPVIRMYAAWCAVRLGRAMACSQQLCVCLGTG